MDNREYENKKRECWEEFCYEHLFDPHNIVTQGIFGYAFDRAYALGKQTGAISQEDVEKAAKTYASEVDKNVRDLYGNIPTAIIFGECAAESFREGVKFALGKQEKDADTVIQGWVARDADVQWVYLYSSMPTRGINMWNGHGSLLMPLDANSFPDLTWDDDPQEVKIIIKKKEEMKEQNYIHKEVKALLEAFGYKPEVKIDNKKVEFSFHVNNGYETMPIRHKDAISMLAKGYLSEFYYGGDTQYVRLYHDYKGLMPDDDRYGCLLHEIRQVDSDSEMTHRGMEVFVNMGDHFKRFVSWKDVTTKE